MANSDVHDAILLLDQYVTAQLKRQKVTLKDANIVNIEGQNMKGKRMRGVKRACHEGNFAKVEKVVENNQKGKGPMFQISGLTRTRVRW